MQLMECQELVERVTDYLDGALSRTDDARLHDHISVCYACVAHLGEYKVMLDLMAEAPVEPIAPDFEAGLLGLHRQWVSGGVGT